MGGLESLESWALLLPIQAPFVPPTPQSMPITEITNSANELIHKAVKSEEMGDPSLKSALLGTGLRDVYGVRHGEGWLEVS